MFFVFAGPVLAQTTCNVGDKNTEAVQKSKVYGAVSTVQSASDLLSCSAEAWPQARQGLSSHTTATDYGILWVILVRRARCQAGKA